MEMIVNNKKRTKMKDSVSLCRLILLLAILTLLPWGGGGSLGVCFAQSPYLQAVDEYVPAPGQFVNTLPVTTADDTPQTVAQKCTEAISGDYTSQSHGMITLGAWGGYVTFHFDHPVVNVPGERDFAVFGNAFENNAEPAIIWVSVDRNQNGMPDDEWYEIKGSEYDNAATIHNYELTYTYSGEKQAVAWTDNQDNSGSISRNKYHKQEYFPLWLTSKGTLTLTGCRLPDNASQVDNGEGGLMWILPAYEYGYADNQPNSNREGCSVDISWAVDAKGNSVTLPYVDFIRCQNAMNQTCGSIGETSTEIIGAEDLHPDATTAISPIVSDVLTPSVYAIHGERLTFPRRGINIIRYADGKTKKIIIK